MDKGAALLNILEEIKMERETQMAEKKQRKISSKKPPMIRETEDGKEKRCPKCEEYHPADQEHFYKDGRGKLGLSSWCRRCQTMKKGGALPSPRVCVEPDGPLIRINIEPDELFKKITLDFSGYEELHEQLVKAAGQDMRTPQMEAMWMIRQSLGSNSKEVADES